VLTAQEDGSAELDDGQLLDRAAELGVFLFPKMKTSSAKEHSV